MTATEELRALLDELGVKWTDHGYENHLWWKGFDGVRWHAENRHCVDGWCVKVEAVITPEQAIAATLGRGTCHSDNEPPLLYDDPWRVFRCSECHHKVNLAHNPKPRYCPNCGREVER